MNVGTIVLIALWAMLAHTVIVGVVMITHYAKRAKEDMEKDQKEYTDGRKGQE